MVRIFSFLLVSLMFAACQQENANEQSSDAQGIVDQAIAAHGSSNLLDQEVSFTFRKRQYGVKRTSDQYSYQHSYTDSIGQMEFDLVNSSVLATKINGIETQLNTKQTGIITERINSVLYFLQLPYGLNDAAVNKKYAGTSTVKGQEYDLVLVTFNQEGGGKDFQDEYLYWVNKSNHMIDFLAYNYIVNGGGVRFREAINRRTINGIVFQDYVNYKPDSKKTPLKELDKLFEAGQLAELSRIISEDVKVDRI